MAADSLSDAPLYDVIIIGGGIAGLTAAYQLMRKAPHLKILVLEAKERVGGRTFSVEMQAAGGTEMFDIGGQWISDEHQHIRTLLEDLKIELYPTYTRGHKAMQFDASDGQEIMYYTNKKIPLKWIPVMKDFAKLAEKIASEMESVSIENPESSSNVTELDSMTLDQFRRKYTWFQESGIPLDSLVSGFFGCDSSQISVSYFLHYFKTAGGLDHVMGETKYCVDGGTQSISLKLREKLGPDKVRIKSPVTKITQEEEPTIVKTLDSEYLTSHVIIACPPGQISKINFVPPLMPEKRVLAERMTGGRIIKIIITYDEAFWRPMGLCGDFVSGARAGPLSAVCEASSVQDSAALAAFIGGARAVHCAGLEAAERQSLVLDHLVQCFGPKARDYIDYREQDWSAEEYIGGGPTFTPSTGAIQYYKYLRQSYNRIHFAGSETATAHCGCMEGAVQSGVRAAKQVLYQACPEAALRADTPLDHIRIEHLPVVKAPANQWSVAGTRIGIAFLLAGGVALAYYWKKR